ncbi:MAG: membrane protein [Oceanospirillum sp.]|nr:membrane protein [Oceanospirillum sp.]
MKERANNWLSIMEACLLVALGVQMINAADLLVGGTAGIGLITLKIFSNLTFGQVFFVINLPFYLISLKYLGLGFTVRTFVAVSLLSGLSDLIEHSFVLDMAHPLLAAISGGLLIGFGLTVLMRNNASIGGTSILAVFLERQYGLAAAKTLLAADIAILTTALFFFPPMTVLYSMVAFVAVSSVLGRYRQAKPDLEPKSEPKSMSEPSLEHESLKVKKAMPVATRSLADA